MTLPLLSSPPAEEVEEAAGDASGEPGGEAGGVTPAPGQPSPAAGENEGKSTPVQEPAKDAAVQGEEQQSGEVAGTETSDNKSVWEEREVPTSEESFFFAVPPLPKPVRRDEYRAVRCLSLYFSSHRGGGGGGARWCDSEFSAERGPKRAQEALVLDHESHRRS